MVRKAEDPEMNPQGTKNFPKTPSKESNEKRGDAIARNVTGKTGTPKDKK